MMDARVYYIETPSEFVVRYFAGWTFRFYFNHSFGEWVCRKYHNGYFINVIMSVNDKHALNQFAPNNQ